MANSNPGLAYGQVPSPAQWNAFFAAKQDWNSILDAIILAGGAASVVAPATWTPADSSGAALVIPSFNVTSTKIGNIVFLSGQITYPTTSNTASASIKGLPFAVPSSNYGICPSSVFNNAGIAIMAVTVPGTSTFRLVAPSTGAAITNAQLSGFTINFAIDYPAS